MFHWTIIVHTCSTFAFVVDCSPAYVCMNVCVTFQFETSCCYYFFNVKLSVHIGEINSTCIAFLFHSCIENFL